MGNLDNEISGISGPLSLTWYPSDCLPVLNTLNLSHNRLTDAESLEHVGKLHSVSVLDLAHNKIDDLKVIDVFEQMQNLVSDSTDVYIYILCYTCN